MASSLVTNGGTHAIDLKYGTGTISIRFPAAAAVSVLQPNDVPVLPSVEDAVSAALAAPAGRPPLQEVLAARRPRSIAVAVPDETRPAPLATIVPPLLRAIEAALPGGLGERVTFFVGGGLHPPGDAAAVERILPADARRGCRVVVHDARRSAMRDHGVTSRGTPVRINAEYSDAELKIAIGQVDPHQFVGFTGGAKAVVIGCAAAETIERNHSLMAQPLADVGRLHGNPVREDLTEAGERVGIDLAINFVLDPGRRVVHLVAGAPPAVLESCAAVCARVYGVALREKFEVVVASCGGHPKDICLYQAQKGLNLASRALVPGGHILLLAAATQGVGDDVFLDYVSRFDTPRAVVRDFTSKPFRMGAHKAYLFARTLLDYDVAVHSELPAEVLRRCHLRPADPAAALRDWSAGPRGAPRIAVVPNANTTYFHQPGSKEVAVNTT